MLGCKLELAASFVYALVAPLRLGQTLISNLYVTMVVTVSIALVNLCASSRVCRAEGTAEAAYAAIQIDFSNQKDSAIRLEARQAPLGQILKEVAIKTGVRIHYSVLPEAPVTATCVGANAAQIMDCLVAKQVGLVANQTRQGEPAEFWLLGSSVGSCQPVTVEAATIPVKALAHQNQPTQATQTNMDKMQQEETELMLKQAQSKDSTERGDAISNLAAAGSKKDPAVDDALLNAMDDQVASVRAQAIKAIVLRGGKDVDAQLGQALKDKDASVRLSAVDVIADDATLLQQALNDSDAAVRSLAKDKLDSLTFKQVRKNK